ncbi:MAG TPA: hypothetical protein VJ879_02320, partial [Desulfobacter sp.]|nr:hypothetical protein [Desulfobacter sp.]
VIIPPEVFLTTTEQLYFSTTIEFKGFGKKEIPILLAFLSVSGVVRNGKHFKLFYFHCIIT